MNDINSIEAVNQDAEAVSAIRSGDAERYRELVERYERRVFAIAWSRLGDAALAEEAAQDAFVRGYQQLRLLSDGAKFAGWISSITRNIAINLGLRHRRELKKRERWALEQVTSDSGESEDENFTPETLRRTLEDIPAAHRECLVLFYLEGKSGLEAATALGISEAAFRVRLHRARVAMREQLDQKLEDSLQNLRPIKPIVPAVMATLFLASSAKAVTGTALGGAGAKAASTVAKSSLLSWFSFLPLIGALPGVLAAWFIGRMDRRNFRDQEGFRPASHRRFMRSFIWGFPTALLLSFVVFNWVGSAATGEGERMMQQTLVLSFFAYLAIFAARSLYITRNSFQVGMFVYVLILALGNIGSIYGLIPGEWRQMSTVLGSLILLAVFKKRPLRLDYNLFLRSVHGLLKADISNSSSKREQCNDEEILMFARFLGRRWLVGNFRWEKDGLALQLPPVENQFLKNLAMVFVPFFRKNGSWILLRNDGSVVAHASSADFSHLNGLAQSKRTNKTELQDFVARSVEHAWREFRVGNIEAAEQGVGQTLDSEVFVVAPERAKSTRWWRLLLGASAALMLFVIVAQYWLPELFSDLKPVSISENEVRGFLNDIEPDSSTHNSFSMGLLTCLVLPSTNLFDADSFLAMRTDVVGGDLKVYPGAIFGDPLVRHALATGWLSWNDCGLQPLQVSDHLRSSRSVDSRDGLYIIGSRQSWSWVIKERQEVLRIREDGVTQLHLLKAVGALEAIDRAKLIQQIVSVQVLSGKSAPNQPTIHHWRNVRGLFHTPAWPTLEDTYFSLAALEVLGGLEKIDRQACIEGILRVHRGKGFFTSPQPGSYNEYKITGSARDTACAFESLRILGGLDAVKDLDKWQFRTERANDGKLTWNNVEAWVLQQRFNETLRQMRSNPQAPVKSLLRDE